MKKYFKFATAVVALVMVAAIVVTFEACRKTGKTVEPTIVQNSRNPIAIYDHNNGAMTYSFDLEKLNHEFNKKVSRTSQDRYIIESIEILDEAPTDAGTNPEIKIVVIDTEEEVSYSTWLMESFATKSVFDDNTCYYIDEDIVIGIYSFVSQDGDVYYQYDVNGNSYSRKETNPAMYSSFRPKWTFTCRSTNCNVGECEKVKIEDYHYTCSPCAGDGASCVRAGIVDIIVGIITSLL